MFPNYTSSGSDFGLKPAMATRSYSAPHNYMYGDLKYYALKYQIPQCVFTYKQLTHL